MNTFEKLLAKVAALEKKLGNSATPTDRAIFAQYRDFANWNLRLLNRRKKAQAVREL
jgi:hypothetical protein